MDGSDSSPLPPIPSLGWKSVTSLGVSPSKDGGEASQVRGELVFFSGESRLISFVSLRPSHGLQTPATPTSARHWNRGCRCCFRPTLKPEPSRVAITGLSKYNHSRECESPWGLVDFILRAQAPRFRLRPTCSAAAPGGLCTLRPCCSAAHPVQR